LIRPVAYETAPGEATNERGREPSLCKTVSGGPE
jgi:hypothetical protein